MRICGNLSQLFSSNERKESLKTGRMEELGDKDWPVQTVRQSLLVSFNAASSDLIHSCVSPCQIRVKVQSHGKTLSIIILCTTCLFFPRILCFTVSWMDFEVAFSYADPVIQVNMWQKWFWFWNIIKLAMIPPYQTCSDSRVVLQCLPVFPHWTAHTFITSSWVQTVFGLFEYNCEDSAV